MQKLTSSGLIAESLTTNCINRKTDVLLMSSLLQLLLLLQKRCSCCCCCCKMLGSPKARRRQGRALDGKARITWLGAPFLPVFGVYVHPTNASPGRTSEAQTPRRTPRPKKGLPRRPR